MDIPNPGSDAAIDQGCTCPVLDNEHGRGAYMADGAPVFYINENCLVHHKAKNPIEQEVEWCEANRGKSGKGAEFEDGFIAGLLQALFIQRGARRPSWKKKV